MLKISSFGPNTLIIQKNGRQVYSLSFNLGIDFRKPIPIDGISGNVKKVTSGIAHSFLIMNDLSIYGFGFNSVIYFY